jgi:hypothetical protein
LQFIKDLIVATLKLCGSLSKETGHHWQFIDADFPDVIMPYLSSSITSISLAAKVALAPLSLKLDDDTTRLLTVPEIVVNALKSSRSVNVEIVNLPLSQASILWFIKSLLYHQNSASSIISVLPNLLDSVSFVIQQGADCLLEKKAVVDLLWKLVYMGHSSDIISHPDLTAQLLSLTGSQENDPLQRLASCVLWKLYDSDMQGIFYSIGSCICNSYITGARDVQYLFAAKPEGACPRAEGNKCRAS